MTSPFTLHDKLAADTFPVTDLGLSRAVLMNDSRYPWIILIPRRPGLRELTDLTAAERSDLMEEASKTALTLKSLYDLERVNVAALGNMVPQLHLHVIGRRTDDDAWPGPVWGVGDAVPYGDAKEIIADLKRGLDA
ncbi:MAG: HIT family protein [Alphaproteobacteria bacterium]|nr:HIT family protein [Alphaproteobacteria bacterium]